MGVEVNLYSYYIEDTQGDTIMKDTPQWIYDLIKKEKLTCSKCKLIFTVKDLISVGVQASTNDPYHETLSIGLLCKKCKEMTVFELKEMSLIELAFEIIDDEAENNIRQKEEDLDKELEEESFDQKPRPKKKSRNKRASRSKITIREIKEVSNFLKGCKTHDDFLMAMGFTPGEINSYKVKTNSKNKREK